MRQTIFGLLGRVDIDRNDVRARERRTDLRRGWTNMFASKENTAINVTILILLLLNSNLESE